MIKIVKKHGLISKEHNGDYIDDYILHDKFKNGLETINIAPEFGQLETSVILDKIKDETDLFNSFYNVCFNSKRWVKWVSEDFNPEKNKLELINICGHYVFSTPEFITIKPSNIDSIILDKIQNKIFNFLMLTELNNYSKVLEYFKLFSNKDIDKLSNLFDTDVTLVDWEISATGKDKVIEANLNIFKSVDLINVDVIDIIQKYNHFSCQLVITINGSEKIDVVDMIKFNENGKIMSIKAYKG